MPRPRRHQNPLQLPAIPAAANALVTTQAVTPAGGNHTSATAAPPRARMHPLFQVSSRRRISDDGECGVLIARDFFTEVSLPFSRGTKWTHAHHPARRNGPCPLAANAKRPSTYYLLRRSNHGTMTRHVKIVFGRLALSIRSTGWRRTTPPHARQATRVVAVNQASEPEVGIGRVFLALAQLGDILGSLSRGHVKPLRRTVRATAHRVPPHRIGNGSVSCEDGIPPR